MKHLDETTKNNELICCAQKCIKNLREQNYHGHFKPISIILYTKSYVHVCIPVYKKMFKI